MPRNQIVFVKSEDEVADLEATYTVVESMDLAEEGFAAIVEPRDESEVEELNYMAVENYDDTLTFNILTAPEGTSLSTRASEFATLDEVRDLHSAHAAEMGDGAGITWVVNDSGIDVSHPIFYEGQVAERHNMTDSGSNDGIGHGTAVAGQIARLAPKTELIDLRIFGAQGSTSFRIVLRALSWLLNNTDEYDGVNMSWGTTQRVRKIDRIIDQLRDKGVRVVTAAGNSGPSEGSPATAERAFAVGSSDMNGNVSSYSTYGPDVPEVMVLGENIRLARAQGTTMGRALSENYVVASGTSFSAPNQAGFESAYLSANPDTTLDEMEEDFLEAADDVSGTDKDGAGLSNLQETLKLRDEKTENAEDVETATATVWQFGGNDSVYIGKDFLEDGKYTVSKEKLLEAFEKQ